MKVSPKTSGVHSTLNEAWGEVRIDYRPSRLDDPVARVVEFPKIWREGGKQYKVECCIYDHNGDRNDRVKIKAPSGATTIACDCEETIEYY